MSHHARTRAIPRTTRSAAALAALIVTLTVSACTPEELPTVNAAAQNAADREDPTREAAPTSAASTPGSTAPTSSRTTPPPTYAPAAPTADDPEPPATDDSADGDSGSPTSSPGRAGPRPIAELPRPAGGRLIFVDPEGDDGASGGEDDPLRTLQEAADRSNPGDVVVARAGDHRPFTVTRSGAPGKEIVFTAAPGQTPRIVPDDETWNGVAVHASHITLRGFHVAGLAKTISQEFALSQRNNRLNPRTNMNCVNISPDPKRPDATPTDIVVSDVRASDCPGGGIGSQRSNRVTVIHSLVEGSSKWSVYGTSPIGYLTPRETDGPDFMRFLNNRSVGNLQIVPWIDNPSDDPDELTEGHGIMLDSGTNTGYDGESLVRDNVSEGNGGNGIHCFKSANVEITGNSTSGNVTNLPSGAEIVVNRCADVQVSDNTVDPDGEESITVIRSERVVQEGNQVR